MSLYAAEECRQHHFLVHSVSGRLFVQAVIVPEMCASLESRATECTGVQTFVVNFL